MRKFLPKKYKISLSSKIHIAINSVTNRNLNAGAHLENAEKLISFYHFWIFLYPVTLNYFQLRLKRASIAVSMFWLNILLSKMIFKNSYII